MSAFPNLTAEDIRETMAANRPRLMAVVADVKIMRAEIDRRASK